MRLLVITSEHRWTEAVRALFSATHDVVSWDPRQLPENRALVRAIDACFVAEAETGALTVETLKQIGNLTDAPLFALAQSARQEWEEAALLAGAQQVFKYPLRAPLIHLSMSRAQRKRAAEVSPTSSSATPFAGTVSTPIESREVLALLRDFSRLLVHAIDGPLFMTEYLRKLREVLRSGRLVLYLPEAPGRQKSFRCAYASGIDHRQFEQIRLTEESGVGHFLAHRGGLALRSRLRDLVPNEAEVLRELDIFGVELAVPLSARDGLVGVLLVGARIAGFDYSENELTLLYHLMEELGAAFKNAELHADLYRERTMFSAVLRNVPVGCAVLGASLQIAHANAAFRAQLGFSESSPLAFEDLPQAWASAAYGVLQKRAPAVTVELDHDLAGVPRKIRLSVRPLEAHGSVESSVFISAEDITAEIRARQEVENASIHSLLQRAGEQLSNEFRNALTPVDIMVQLSRDPGTSRSELERLGTQVGAAIHRLRRRVDDLAYLTKSALIPELTTVSTVLRHTRERLEHWLDEDRRAMVAWPEKYTDVAFTADSRGVALAVAELIMNAIEASDQPSVVVSIEDLPDSVDFKVRNSGSWAPPPESSGFRHRPFVSNKSNGVGLGVEVASRVGEHHGGRLLLGPVAPDVIEATLRLPRALPLLNPL